MGTDGILVMTSETPSSVAADVFPAGTIALWCGGTVPTGWQLCDGTAINRGANPNYTAQATSDGFVWGAGDGSTTVNVPDFRDFCAVGKSGTKALASSGGAETHAMTVAEMPAHDHGGATGTGTTGNAGTHTHGYNAPVLQGQVPAWTAGAVRNASTTTGRASSSNGAHAHSIPALAISNDGSGTAMSLMQPYKAIHFIVRIG